MNTALSARPDTPRSTAFPVRGGGVPASPQPARRPPAPEAAALAGNGLGQLPAAVLDAVDCGLIVCTESGEIRLANRAARREMASGVLLAQLDGRLVRGASARGDLDTALRGAAQRGRRCLVPLAAGDARLLAGLQPLPGVDDDGEALVLVVLGRRRPCSDLGLELLAASHGLTHAERRVLAGLVEQASPREIAERHGVALSTVRTQILSLRSKLGARSIEELLLRTAEVPPMAGALSLV